LHFKKMAFLFQNSRDDFIRRLSVGNVLDEKTPPRTYYGCCAVWAVRRLPYPLNADGSPTEQVLASFLTPCPFPALNLVDEDSEPAPVFAANHHIVDIINVPTIDLMCLLESGRPWRITDALPLKANHLVLSRATERMLKYEIRARLATIPCDGEWWPSPPLDGNTSLVS
jgi:hypothetical protein